MNNLSPGFKALEFYGNRLHHPGQWRIHALFRQCFNVDIDCDLEVERAGLRWLLNPSDYVHRDLFWLGERDRWNFHHIMRLLPADAVVCDVGANFGYYSIMLAASLKGQSRFFAFEPNPVTRLRLERNVALNQLGSAITVLPCALSDTPGTAQMTSRKDNSGAAHICANGETEVEVTTLDAICDKHQLKRLDFVKIDVEGFEGHVLRGGEKSLRAFRPVLLVEIMAEQLERAGTSPAELVSLLQDYGYSLYESERTRLVRLTKLPSGPQLINALCVPAAD